MLSLSHINHTERNISRSIVRYDSVLWLSCQHVFIFCYGFTRLAGTSNTRKRNVLFADSKTPSPLDQLLVVALRSQR